MVSVLVARVRRVALVLAAQQCDLCLEVLGGAEGLIHGGEAEVGDFVESAQRRQDRQANVVGVDLGSVVRTNALLNLVGEQLEVVV